jgi:flagellar assembly protein FliH
MQGKLQFQEVDKMQSSYKVIKSNSVVNEGNKEIVSNYIGPKEIVVETKECNPEFESIEKIAAGIIENAQRESKNIVFGAYEKAKIIENDAKEMGFQQGYEEGRNIGYNDGYEEGFNVGKAQGDAIVENANFMLFQAKEEYNKFIKEKELHFRNLVVSTVESILKREVVESESLNSLIFQVLEEEKQEKAFIIKCNSNYYPSLQGEILNFKNKLAFRGDIFVVEDNLLQDGTIIIEKDSGKTTLSIDYSIEKLKALLMES